jgi:hypothetical protein
MTTNHSSHKIKSGSENRNKDGESESESSTTQAQHKMGITSMDKNKKIFFMKLNKIHIPKLNKKPALLIPFARYRPHTMSPDLPIVWPLNTRLVLDHPRSSALGLLLLS